MALHPCFQPASPQLPTPLPYIYIYPSTPHPTPLHIYLPLNSPPHSPTYIFTPQLPTPLPYIYIYPSTPHPTPLHIYLPLNSPPHSPTYIFTPQLPTPLPYIYIYPSTPHPTPLHIYLQQQVAHVYHLPTNISSLLNEKSISFNEHFSRIFRGKIRTGDGDWTIRWLAKKYMMRQEKKTGQKNKGKERPGKSNGSPEIPPQEMDIRHPQDDWFMNKTCFWQIPQRRWWGVDWQPPWRWPLRWWRTHGHSQCPPGSRGSRSPECRPCCNTGQLGHLLACSAAGWLQETELFISDTNRTHPLLLQLMMMIIII